MMTFLKGVAYAAGAAAATVTLTLVVRNVVPKLPAGMIRDVLAKA